MLRRFSVTGHNRDDSRSTEPLPGPQRGRIVLGPMLAPGKQSPQCEAELAGLCARLGAENIGDVSPEELQMLTGARDVPSPLVDATRDQISRGDDPLGEWFCELRSAATRRRRGATYTPLAMVAPMIAWAARVATPTRVVDPGVGSARFLLQAAHAFPAARLIGVELDALAALTARANLAVAELQDRAEIRLCDYRSLELHKIDGATLFVGNPPYVRHHDIDASWKTWLTETADHHGLRASQLSGLHVHFFMATLGHAQRGDIGALVTASEWLDVNYGKLVRDLLAGPLGLRRLDVLSPRLAPFADAQTTAAIACFRVGHTSRTAKFRHVITLDEIATLSGGADIARERLASSPRWSRIERRHSRPHDFIELGELCRVHRGQVTGANAVWISGPETPTLPAGVLRPTITKARELFAAGDALLSSNQLRTVVDLPRDLTAFSPSQRGLIDEFLRWARASGAHRGYVASHRAPWWAVKLRAPAPILATYMARRPPAFVRNLAEARHINIAHGLYPRDPLSGACLDALATHLATSVSVDDGRTYAGGLTKFEPKEMERLLVPRPRVLEQLAAQTPRT